MTAPALLHFAGYENHLSPHPERFAGTWNDVVEMLTEHRETTCESDPSSDLACAGKTCNEKKGTAWSPVLFLPHDRCETSRGGGTRTDTNVVSVSALVLDLDHMDDAALERAMASVESKGLAFVAHTTHNNRPPEDYCLRLVVRLSRAVSAADWPRFLAAAVAHLNVPADPACKNLSRIYFLPSHPRGGTFGTATAEGKALDVDALLAAAPPAAHGKTRATVSLPRTPAAHGPATEPVAPPQAVDLGKLTGTLKRLRTQYEKQGETEKAEVVRRVVDGDALGLPGERDANVHRASCILAYRFPLHTPPEAAVEVLRRSIAAMPTEPEGLAYWLAEARDGYERAMVQRVDEDRRTREVNARLAAGMRSLVPPSRRSAEERAAEAQDAQDEGGEPADPDAPEEPHPDAWMESLIFKKVKSADEEPSLVACEYNAGLLLTHLPEWRGCIRWNELTKDLEVRGSPLAPTDTHTSVLPRACADYLHRFYGLAIGEHQLKSTLLLVARRNPFDPIRDYLNGLKWDGVPRLDAMLTDYCNARLVDADGNDISRHVRDAGRKWMIAAAVRVFSPGEQVDSVLVLEGEMGSGKSRFFRTLAGRYAATSQLHLASKDATMVAARSWIVELAELDSVRKSDREATNAALTIQTDMMRPPYGASVEEFPRRCVFAGTTEDDDWLSSPKGIRRWWPVSVGTVDLTRLRHDRDQLWAEAAALAKAALEEKAIHGETQTPALKWWFSSEEEKQAHRIAAERIASTVVKEAILAWWFGLDPKQRPTTLTTHIVLKDALHASADKPQRSLEIEVGNVLRDDLGCHKERRRVGASRAYVYVPSEAARTADKIVTTRPVNPAAQFASLAPRATP